MKLERPVVNQNGLMLVGEGTELTGALIEKIRSMNVDAVYVHGAPRELPPREETLAQLDERFRNVEDMPHMAMLKQVVKAHIEGLYRAYGSENPES
jgi:hypothetical protein